MASESLLQRGFKSHSHKRLTFVFTGESGYTLAFTNRIAHTGSHGETGAFRTGGWDHYPRIVLRGSETLRGRDLKRQTLPLFGLGQVCSRRAQRAFGTAMCSCASLFRGVAAPLGCVIPLLFLSPHRWASRFCLSMITARREHICCFHTLVCSMRLATRCRSFALSTASICRL